MRAEYLFELGRPLRRARRAGRLTQLALARRVGLGRTTVNQLEAGVCSDLGVKKLMRLLNAVGLELAVVRVRRKAEPDFIKMASISASVSYRRVMTPEELAAVLLTGKVPYGLEPHLEVVFDELPPKVLAGAIRQVAKVAARPERIVENARAVARDIGSELRVAGS